MVARFLWLHQRHWKAIKTGCLPVFRVTVHAQTNKYTWTLVRLHFKYALKRRRRRRRWQRRYIRFKPIPVKWKVQHENLIRKKNCEKCHMRKVPKQHSKEKETRISCEFHILHFVFFLHPLLLLTLFAVVVRFRKNGSHFELICTFKLSAIQHQLV